VAVHRQTRERQPRAASAELENVLACCHGYEVRAADGRLGVVETPVFSGTRLRPDFLVVRTDETEAGRCLVPVNLVEEVDPDAGSIALSSLCEDVVGARPD
jgi:hypothetical protein